MDMASCVKCGKPIGLMEYALGDSRQFGLCKSCRTTKKWCNSCMHMLALSLKDDTLIRCTKYGYDLSNQKNWKSAANCQDYMAKTVDKNSDRARVYRSSS